MQRGMAGTGPVRRSSEFVPPIIGGLPHELPSDENATMTEAQIAEVESKYPFMKEGNLEPLVDDDFISGVIFSGVCFVCEKAFNVIDKCIAAHCLRQRCCPTCVKRIGRKNEDGVIARYGWRIGFYCQKCSSPVLYALKDRPQCNEDLLHHRCALCSKRRRVVMVDEEDNM
jgi:hypothetical protein